jgi:hypothetical protein
MADFVGILIIVLAAAVVGIAYFTNKYSWRKCIALRLEGIRVNRLTKQLLLDLQQHRGMVNAFLSGDSSFKQKIEQKQTAIGKDMSALDAVHDQGLMTAKRCQDIRVDWQALRTEVLTLPAEESFRRHSLLIRAVLYTMGDVAERSQIVDMCSADCSLVDALWSKLPAVAEGLGQARGMGSSVAAKGYCSSVARIKLRFLKERVGETMKWVNDDLAQADLAQASSFTQAWKQTHLAVNEFLALLDEKIINVERPSIDAEHYFNAGTKALDAVFHAFDQASTALENTLTRMPEGGRAA